MDLDPIDLASPTAPFEQLRAQMAARAADGRLPAGTRLPTVRALAADLGLAAGSVAKAYRGLETDGVVRTEGRRGTFVQSRTAPRGEVTRLAEALAHAARADGLTLAETQRLLEGRWS